MPAHTISSRGMLFDAEWDDIKAPTSDFRGESARTKFADSAAHICSSNATAHTHNAAMAATRNTDGMSAGVYDEPDDDGSGADRNNADVAMHVGSAAVSPQGRRLVSSRNGPQSIIRSVSRSVSSESDQSIASHTLRSLFGSTISACTRLVDLEGRPGAYFVFPELCMRVEGHFRLKFTSFDLANCHAGQLSSRSTVSVLSNIFQSFNPRSFPGMQKSPPLIQHFFKQGAHVLVRSKIPSKKRRRNGQDVDDD
eukprot:jgi/Hompol1/7048/HPOL_000469-RA